MKKQTDQTESPLSRRLFVAFQVKGYAWFWSSLFWSAAGMSGRMLAQGWLVLELTGEDAPLWLGAMAAMRAVGSTGLSPLGGIVVDRFDRRHILVAMQMFNMTTSLALGVLVVTGWVAMWHVMVVSLLQGVVMSISMPARNAMTFDLAGRETILNAMSANFLASDLMRIVSPVIAGVITATAGPASAFFFLSGSFVVATFCVLQLPPTPTNPRGRRSIWSSLGEGVTHAARHPSVRIIMVLDVVMSIFAYSAQLMLPVFARDALGLGPTGLGLLMAAPGLGAFGMGMVIASSPNLKPTHLRYFLASAGYAAAVILWASSPWFATALFFLALNGVASAWFNSLSSSLVQVVVPEEYRARMIGLQGFTWGLMSFGGLTTGLVASIVGVPVAVAGLAAVPIAATVFLVAVAKRYSVSR